MRLDRAGLDDRDPHLPLEGPLDCAKANFIPGGELGLNDGVAVNESFIRRSEIFQPVPPVDPDELGVIPGDRGVLDADDVARFPADGDDFLIELEADIAPARDAQSQATLHGRSGSHGGFPVAPVEAKNAFNIAEPEVVGIVDLGFGNLAPVDPGVIGGPQILKPKTLPVLDDLRMPPGDGGVFYLDKIVIRPPDRDNIIIREFMRHCAGIGELDLERGHRGATGNSRRKRSLHSGMNRSRFQ